MSLRIIFIGEGDIDSILVSALISRVASDRCGFTWSVPVDDDLVEWRSRKTGHGGVARKLKAFLELRNRGQLGEYDLCVVVLDQRTATAKKEVRRLARGREDVVFGVAIHEVEAWWLGDRTSTLAWLRLAAGEVAPLRYDGASYSAERDTAPKQTLNELTRRSEAVDTVYGDGNVELALEFAAGWATQAHLSQIEHQCPKGFRPFAEALERGLKRAKRTDQARRGVLPGLP